MWGLSFMILTLTARNTNVNAARAMALLRNPLIHGGHLCGSAKKDLSTSIPESRSICVGLKSSGLVKVAAALPVVQLAGPTHFSERYLRSHSHFVYLQLASFPGCLEATHTQFINKTCHVNSHKTNDVQLTLCSSLKHVM